MNVYSQSAVIKCVEVLVKVSDPSSPNKDFPIIHVAPDGSFFNVNRDSGLLMVALVDFQTQKRKQFTFYNMDHVISYSCLRLYNSESTV